VPFRAIRLALDRFASLEGHRHAKYLCGLYGSHFIPRDALDLAEDEFRDTARQALSEARIEGDQEALLLHLMELWHLSLAVELRRQSRNKK
jgi:hypothetical protein